MSIHAPLLYFVPASAPLTAVELETLAGTSFQALETPGTPEETGGKSPLTSIFGGWFPVVMIVAIFWFVVIGPERRSRKVRETMLAGVKKGDKVMTNGGLYGTVSGVQDQVLTLTVADGVRMRFARSAIQTILAEEPAKEKEPAAD